jgi:hypothetical protein
MPETGKPEIEGAAPARFGDEPVVKLYRAVSVGAIELQDHPVAVELDR